VRSGRQIASDGVSSQVALMVSHDQLLALTNASGLLCDATSVRRAFVVF